MLHLWNCPIILGFSVLVFFVIVVLFFPLHVSWEVSIDLFFQAYWFFLQLCQVYRWSHWRHFSFLLVFWISTIFFWFFLKIFLSLLTLPSCPCILSPFSIRCLFILIIFNLNFLSDDSNICIIPQFRSGACFLSSDYVSSSLLTWPVIICWKLDILYWVIRTEVNRT